MSSPQVDGPASVVPLCSYELVKSLGYDDPREVERNVRRIAVIHGTQITGWSVDETNHLWALALLTLLRRRGIAPHQGADTLALTPELRSELQACVGDQVWARPDQHPFLAAIITAKAKPTRLGVNWRWD